MKKIIFIVILWNCFLNGYTQKFEEKFIVELPDSAASGEINWVDLDNDSLLDVIVIAQSKSGQNFLLTYKSNLSQGLVWQSSQQTEFTNTSFLLTDADADNYIDLFLAGDLNGQPTTVLFLNNGNFMFDLLPVISKAGSVLKMADLDQDGKNELVISGIQSGIPFLSIYQHKLNSWQLAHDSIKVKAESIEVFDFDGDGDNDFFVSGIRSDNTIINSVYYNERGFFFRLQVLPSAFSGNTSLADLDHDGNFDILLAGKNNQAENRLVALLNRKGSFAIKDSLLTLQNQKIFAADFNSNGLCDINFSGLNQAGDSVNLIFSDAGDYDSLNTKGLMMQRFGDFDRDGDLDLLQLIKSAADQRLVIFENKTSDSNQPPGKPFNPFALIFFNRLFLYWEKPLDDHTKKESLTYDVTLQTSAGEWLTGEFDLINGKRLSVSHGNNGNNNFLLLRSSGTDLVNFAIQSVDNSFHAGKDGMDGICSGTGGGTGDPCNTLTVEEQEFCKNENVILTAVASSLWFSFSKGLLATAGQYEFTASEPDTIFSFTPQQDTSCASVKVYIIKIPDNLVKKSLQLRLVCEGDQLKFGVESGWQTVEWGSSLKGFISSQDSILFTVIRDDTVKVNLSDGQGCNIQRNTFLKISKPIVELNGEIFQILKGESVQLIAAGGTEYLWTPSVGLSQDNIPDPIASPDRTTEYEVLVKDSVTCAAVANVLVIVEGTAFVPSLFTPNDDGKNDELKIYGLNSVKSFSFTIHNREGSLVYESHNASDATLTGWNGSVNGNQQPSGVYYWKVKGELSSGRQVKLNGKSSGSIVLIR